MIKLFFLLFSAVIQMQKQTLTNWAFRWQVKIKFDWKLQQKDKIKIL